MGGCDEPHWHSGWDCHSEAWHVEVPVDIHQYGMYQRRPLRIRSSSVSSSSMISCHLELSRQHIRSGPGLSQDQGYMAAWRCARERKGLL
jgi:hypothetical protein